MAVGTATLVLDMKMSEAFDWSDDATIVREALWDHTWNQMVTIRIKQLPQ